MNIQKMKKIFAYILVFGMAFSPAAAIPSTAYANDAVTINPVDYGADPTGEEDSAEAIWEAFEAAKEATKNGASHVTVDFPKGEYHIYKDKVQQREYHTSNTNSIENPTKWIGLLIEDQENFTLQGNGSLFLMHGNMMALAVVRSKNVTLENFSWDFGVPTVTEMTVEKLGTTEDGKEYTDYLIPECFPHEVDTANKTIIWHSEKSPYDDTYYWTQTGIHSPSYGIGAYQPNGEMARSYYTSDSPFSRVSDIEEIDDTHVRIVYNSKTDGMRHMQQEGAVIQFAANAHRQTAGAFTWESENVTADHVNVHYMHGFGWLIQMSKDVYYRNCDLLPREGSGHMVVSFADGIHASGASGDLVIENCNFSDTHDDPINLHGTFTRVEQKKDDHTLILKYIHTQQGGFPQFHQGDQVAFFTRDTLESTDNETLYTVDEVISNPGENGNDLRTMEIRFAETLPENLTDKIGGEPKYVAENVTYAPQVTIRGCTFKNVPTRGILCTTRNKVLIEDNIFHGMTMATIYLSNDSNEWYESGPIRDMTIRNNIFYIKTIGRTSWEYAPAIYVHPVTKGGSLPSEDNPIHKNILIEDNTFFMDTDTVVKAESVENLTIRNNKILRMDPKIEIEISTAKTRLLAGDRTTLQTAANGDVHTKNTDNVYEFTKCKNVTLENNTYDDGLKRYAVLAGMSEENLTNLDPDIQITADRDQPASAPAEKISYVSSNPDVLSVDKNGKMTAKKPGTATVYACYDWNGTLFQSNALEITVEDAGSLAPEDAVKISDEEDVVLTEAEASHSFTAKTQSGKDIAWSVEDFLTGGSTDAAVIDETGCLTAKKNGIVWVKAEAGISTDRKAVVISLPDADSLNPAFTITRRDKENYTLSDNLVTIDMQSGDLYETNNTVKNLFLYQIPDDLDKDNIKTAIKADNLPPRESNQWDTVSFFLYKDDDNYISCGKKSHYDGITTVEESNGTSTETGGSADNNAISAAYLGFYKNGDSVSVDFKEEGGSWQHQTDIPAAMLGSDYKIGFTAWETNDRGNKANFSEFHAGSGDLSYDELCALPAVSFMAGSNQAPQALDAAWDKTEYTVGDNAHVTYRFSDADNDSEGKTLYCLTYENGFTEVTDSPDFTLSIPGKTICHIYPVDAKGMPGQRVSTPITDVKPAGQDIDNPPKPPVSVKKKQTITAFDITKTYNTKPFSSGAKTDGGGTLTYNIKNRKVADINASGTISIKGYGKTEIEITATANGEYEAAAKTITLTVLPKAPKVSTAKSQKAKTLLVKWKKDKLASGYFIQCSTDKKFRKNVKTVKIPKNKTVSKKVTKLKSKKKYYVRVCAYTSVGGQTIKGAYGKLKKSVKVK